MPPGLGAHDTVEVRTDAVARLFPHIVADGALPEEPASQNWVRRQGETLLIGGKLLFPSTATGSEEKNGAGETCQPGHHRVHLPIILQSTMREFVIEEAPWI